MDQVPVSTVKNGLKQRDNLKSHTKSDQGKSRKKNKIDDLREFKHNSRVQAQF